jgi:hypothetical protein
MIVLDTYHISILQHGESFAADQLWQRLADSKELIVTSAVTVEEQARSWLALINRYSDVAQQVTYYDRFVASLRFDLGSPNLSPLPAVLKPLILGRPGDGNLGRLPAMGR